MTTSLHSVSRQPSFLDDSDRLIDLAARLDLQEINRFISRYFDPSRFGMIRVAQRLGRENFHRYVRAFGFGEARQDQREPYDPCKAGS